MVTYNATGGGATRPVGSPAASQYDVDMLKSKVSQLEIELTTLKVQTYNLLHEVQELRMEAEGKKVTTVGTKTLREALGLDG